MKFTSKYRILLLKRFKTWLFSDPSCWSELVWNWDPPKTTEWRQLTLCPFWLIFEFENLARLSFLKFPIGSICRPQNWKSLFFFTITQHHFQNCLWSNFPDRAETLNISLKVVSIHPKLFSFWFQKYFFGSNSILGSKESVASPSYSVNSDYPYSFPRLCGPKNEVTWIVFKTPVFYLMQSRL